MTDPFRSAKRRIARADAHIQQLHTGIREFMNSEPYAVVVEPDFVHRVPRRKLIVRQVRPFPDELGDLAAEAVDALRSALDHACYAAANKPGAKYTSFPFGDSEAELETCIKGRCKDLPAELVEKLRGYRPYKGGDDTLWAFNKARQSNQHKLLIDVSAIITGTAADYINLKSDGYVGIHPPRWDSQKQEMEVAEWGEGTDVEFYPKIALSITFKNAGVISGKRAIPLLSEFRETVATIVSDIEKSANLSG